MRQAVPRRTYSNSRRACLPGATVRVGCLGLRAAIAVFSSTDRTSALTGGSRYNPQMSAARSQNSGVSRRLSQPVTLWTFRSKL